MNGVMVAHRPVNPVGKTDTGSVASLLARAFHDDPMFQYLAPDPDGRRLWVTAFFRATVKSLMPLDCLVHIGGVSEGGVVGLTRPGGYPPPLMTEVLGALSLAGPLFRSGPGLLRRLRAVGLLQEMAAKHPAEPHWYLHPLGVSPDAQGSGLGGALMRHVLSVVEGSEHPIFLETSNPVNLTFYERFGFTTHCTYPTPRGRPPMWTMIRPANAGAQRERLANAS